MLVYLTILLLLAQSTAQVIKLPFTNVGNEISAKVTVGTPPQPLNLFIDFDSDEYFALSTDCQNCRSGLQRHLFNKAKSSSFLKLNQKFNYTDFMHGPVSGNLGQDILRISGKSVGNHDFGYANTTSRFFNTYTRNFDGLLGLKSSQKNGYNHGVQRILSSVGRKIFTIYQKSTAKKDVREGIITFGGFDNQNCDSQRKTFTLESHGLKGWNFQASQFTVGTKKTRPVKVSADPTYDVSFFPEDQYYAIYAAFNAKEVNGKLLVDCGYEKSTVTIEGLSKIEIPGKLFIERKDGECYLNIYRSRAANKLLRLSKRIYNNFCVSYDLESNKVIISERFQKDE